MGDKRRVRVRTSRPSNDIDEARVAELVNIQVDLIAKRVALLIQKQGHIDEARRQELEQWLSEPRCQNSVVDQIMERLDRLDHLEAEVRQLVRQSISSNTIGPLDTPRNRGDTENPFRIGRGRLMLGGEPIGHVSELNFDFDAPTLREGGSLLSELWPPESDQAPGLRAALIMCPSRLAPMSHDMGMEEIVDSEWAIVHPDTVAVPPLSHGTTLSLEWPNLDVSYRSTGGSFLVDHVIGVAVYDGYPDPDCPNERMLFSAKLGERGLGNLVRDTDTVRADIQISF